MKRKVCPSLAACAVRVALGWNFPRHKGCRSGIVRLWASDVFRLFDNDGNVVSPAASNPHS